MANPLEGITKQMDKLRVDFDGWVKTQNIAVEAVAQGVAAGLQGAFLGGVVGSLNYQVMKGAAEAAGATDNPLFKSQMAMSAPPQIMARNFFVLTGVNAGVASALKRYRGVDDIYTAMWAAFASGAAFSLVSSADSPDPAQRFNLMGAFSGGTIFGLIQGAFYKIGESWTGPKVDETSYLRTKYMLQQLGLAQYERNLKDGKLDDATLMLLSDSALKEVKVPAGPRLLILNYVDFYRNQARATNALHPNLPVPGPNGQPMNLSDPWPQPPQQTQQGAITPAASTASSSKGGKGAGKGLP